MNAETDFVSKGDEFRLFLRRSLKLLLDRGITGEYNKTDGHIEGLLRDIKFDEKNNVEEARKLLTAKTKEKIEVSHIRGVQGSMGTNSNSR